MRRSIFEQAEGCQLLSTDYSASNTSVHTLKMYRFQSTITESQQYALKVITLSSSLPSAHSLGSISLKNKDITKVRTEITALERLRGYGSTVELYEVITEEAMQQFFCDFLKKASKKGRSFGLLMEYCPGGTLKDYISKHSLSEIQIISLSLQILECILDMQECQILHRDLRSSNILFSDSGNLKVIDFDCAFIRGFSRRESLNFATVEAVTAPEVMELMDNRWTEKEEISEQDMWRVQEKCDLYSLGTLIYQMITREEFRKDEWEKNIIQVGVSNQLKEIIGMLLKEEVLRITHNQTLSYFSFLAQKNGFPQPTSQKRKLTKQSLALPQLNSNPSISSQSISNTISLSDWSLGSANEVSHAPNRHHERTTTLALNLPSAHHTLHC